MAIFFNNKLNTNSDYIPGKLLQSDNKKFENQLCLKNTKVIKKDFLG